MNNNSQMMGRLSRSIVGEVFAEIPLPNPPNEITLTKQNYFIISLASKEEMIYDFSPKMIILLNF